MINKKLPKYMQPTNIYTQLEDFPRNVNGKINKKNLFEKVLKFLA